MSARRLALAILLASATAHAATSDCSMVSDGTPCIGPCIASGVCMAGTCQVTTLSPDGTPCSSGNACTLGDSCKAGVCIQGTGMVTCPNKLPCFMGMCDPTRGCILVNTCKRDMSPLPDLAQPPADLAGADLAGADLAGVDLAGADLAGVDQSVPGDGSVGADGGTDDLSVPVEDSGAVGDGGINHVRGSALGGGCDCRMTGRGGPTGTVLAGLFLLGLALRRRR